ncbi:hypothetical protein GCM10010394_02090 [Streptomyces crystallinus]|uniref:Uncharacterized protein n=1 Tax=Streptomyces crystallinus TaxID=68191 RepID=A0ABN1EXN6_9ACTN
MDELFRSDRYYKVWQYTVSHRRLLLRSSRDNPPSTRIDVHFGGVTLMSLQPYYDGLTIRRGTASESTEIASRHGIEVNPRQLHVLGEGLTSYVVSGPVQWYEDDGGFDSPSWFGHMRGTP